MTTLREAAQIALDVLDDINQCSLPPTGIPLPAEIDEAMDSLRAALAAPPEELDLPKVRLWQFLRMIEGKEDFRGIPIMRTEWPTRGEALEQPEPEELAQLEQAMIEAWKPIPQREWVGLTDEERQECLYSDPIFGMAASTFAHAIEAKLREKNFDRPS